MENKPNTFGLAIMWIGLATIALISAGGIGYIAFLCIHNVSATLHLAAGVIGLGFVGALAVAALIKLVDKF